MALQRPCPGRTPGAGEFQTASACVGDVLGAPPTDAGERSSDGDDEVIKRVEKRGSVEVQTSNLHADYDAHYQSLLPALDPNSALERTFIDHLYRNNLRLPDSAQKRTPGVFSQPDFHYVPRIWVFVDGNVHDRPEVAAEDRKKRGELLARGDEVIVYRYDQNLEALIASRPDIFRKVR